MKRILIAFALLAALYLALMFSGLPISLLVILKVAPVSLLMVFAWFNKAAPRFLPLALFFSACGDALLALPLEKSFLFGLGAFLVAQLIYAWGFFRQRQPGSIATRLKFCAVLAYLAILAVVLVPKTGGMQVAVAFYMLAIGAMAATAAVHRAPSALIFAGAVLFVLSDSMIAIERFADAFTGSRYAVMATYYAAQALLTIGIIRYADQEAGTLKKLSLSEG